MTSATTLLTMLAMLWHAVAGCCAHHVHEDVSHSHGETVQTASLHTHSCHHGSPAEWGEHEHASHDGQAGGHSHPQGLCDDAGCVFSMPDSSGQFTSLSKAIGCQPYFDTASLAAVVWQPREVLAAQGRHPHRELHAHACARLHLQLSILLI